jgi:demethylspheroidene O-methyltransferase
VALVRAVRARFRRWLAERILRPGFLERSAASPATRPFARRQARALHDLVAGFVHSQTLLAAFETGLLASLRGGPADAATLAAATGLREDRLRRLAQAAAGIGLVTRDGRDFALAPLGAAALAAPGVAAIVRHHRLFYGDLADPVRLLREDRPETALRDFWAYLACTDARALDPMAAEAYSSLMAATQTLVADETLEAVRLDRVRRLIDIGGGNGAFLAEAARRYPALEIVLFDLPAVVAAAEARFRDDGILNRARLCPGSFLDDPIPRGCDAASLVRVLYDHGDDVVAALLARVRAILPEGGLLLISEPMSGGDRPDRIGDTYFGLYTLAMTSGRPRAPAEYAAFLTRAGFRSVRHHRTRLGLFTSVVTARA